MSDALDQLRIGDVHEHPFDPIPGDSVRVLLCPDAGQDMEATAGELLGGRQANT